MNKISKVKTFYDYLNESVSEKVILYPLKDAEEKKKMGITTKEDALFFEVEDMKIPVWIEPTGKMIIFGLRSKDGTKRLKDFLEKSKIDHEKSWTGNFVIKDWEKYFESSLKESADMESVSIMKYIKKFEKFNKINEEFIGFVAGAGIWAIYYILIGRKYPFLSYNFFENIKRWYQVSKVVKKYDKLLKELDYQFKGDPKLKSFYSEIKKLGHDSIGHQNQTKPGVFVDDLKNYILHNVSQDIKSEVEEMLEEMREEIDQIVPDL